MSVSYSEKRKLLIYDEDGVSCQQEDEIDAKNTPGFQPQQPQATAQQPQQQPSNNTTMNSGSNHRRISRSRKKSNHFRNNKTGEPLTVDFILAAKNTNNLSGGNGARHHDALNATSSSSSLKKQGELTNMRKRYFRNLKKKHLKISRPFLSQVF